MASDVVGRFVVLEGIDGSGLSTHASQLHRFLRDKLHLRAHLTKEPTDGPAGAQLRMGLRGRLEIDDTTFALLFAADRTDHLATEVIPRLESGVQVVCDRYYLSSLAYQSLSLDTAWLSAINALCRRPDITVFLDVPVSICISRLRSQRWQLELFETAEKLEAVRANYQRLIPELKQNGENIVVIPGAVAGRERTVTDVARDVRAAVQQVLT